MKVAQEVRFDSRMLVMLLVALLTVFSLWHFVLKVMDVYHHGYFDLPIFVQAAIRYWRGEAIYVQGDLLDLYKPGAIVFKFPPPYLLHFLLWFDASGKWPSNFQLLLTLIYIAIHIATLMLTCWLVLRCRKGKNSGELSSASLLFLLLAIAFAALYVPFFMVQGNTSAEGYIGAFALLANTMPVVGFLYWHFLCFCQQC